MRIVVGALAGSPLQVSGPAAGLAVVVFELVRDHGMSALGPILILAGAIQIVAGILKLGGWFRAISPAVVHGMLAGIGLLIVVGQFHVLFDAKPLPSGLLNLTAMPGRLLGLSPDNIQAAELAFGIGMLTIVCMIGWEKVRQQVFDATVRRSNTEQRVDRARGGTWARGGPDGGRGGLAQKANSVMIGT